MEQWRNICSKLILAPEPLDISKLDFYFETLAYHNKPHKNSSLKQFQIFYSNFVLLHFLVVNCSHSRNLLPNKKCLSKLPLKILSEKSRLWIIC